MYKNLAILVMLGLGVSGCSVNHSGEKSTAEDQQKKLPGPFDSFLDPSTPWYKASLGSWECAAPVKNPDATLICTKGNRYVVMAREDSDGFTVSIPIGTKNNPMPLSLADEDNDGNYDRLDYNGISKSGEHLRIVSDDDLDGNIDRIIDIKKKKTSVRIDNAWIELESVGRDNDGLYIYKGKINGKEKRVIFKDYPYQVVDLPVDVSKTTQKQQ